MKMKMQAAKAGLAMWILLSITVFNQAAFASHSWNNYHWARRSNPFTLKVVDSNTSDWDDNLNRAITDWSVSSVLDLTREQGDESRTARKRCQMIAGKIRSCNADYGNNGWLGLASINLSGGHISQGSSKMNDSYLRSSSYSETNRQARHVPGDRSRFRTRSYERRRIRPEYLHGLFGRFGQPES